MSATPHSEFNDRLRAVENALTAHTAECKIRNQDNAEWRKEISADVGRLKLTMSKAIGYGLGVAAASGVSAAAASQAFVKLFGG